MSLNKQFGSIVPSQKQQLLDTNFLKFNEGDNDFAQQYLPEIYEQEVERYGNRTLSGFLRMVGAEMPMTSDQVIWSEQNRLHISYKDCDLPGATTIDVNPGTAPDIQNVVSVNDTVVVLQPSTGKEAKGIVTVVAGSVLTVTLFATGTTLQGVFGAAAADLKLFVYGSAYQKGTNLAGTTINSTRISVTPSFTQYSNSPVIIRNQYVINGSDMAQIGWVEVATEDGTSGYLWYLKAESETRLRFEDYLEMALVEGERNTNAGANDYQTDKLPGTQGLFAAIEDRGNVNTGFTAAAGLDAFDDILKNLDTQGAIEENMLFLQRQTALDF